MNTHCWHRAGPEGWMSCCRVHSNGQCTAVLFTGKLEAEEKTHGFSNSLASKMHENVVIAIFDGIQSLREELK